VHSGDPVVLAQVVVENLDEQEVRIEGLDDMSGLEQIGQRTGPVAADVDDLDAGELFEQVGEGAILLDPDPFRE